MYVSLSRPPKYVILHEIKFAMAFLCPLTLSFHLRHDVRVQFICKHHGRVLHSRAVNRVTMPSKGNVLGHFANCYMNSVWRVVYSKLYKMGLCYLHTHIDNPNTKSNKSIFSLAFCTCCRFYSKQLCILHFFIDCGYYFLDLPYFTSYWHLKDVVIENTLLIFLYSYKQNPIELYDESFYDIISLFTFIYICP